MKAEYISHSGTDLMAVNAARVSMDKESGWIWVPTQELDLTSGNLPTEPIELERKLDPKDEKLIGYLAKHKHFSCFEHQVVTLRLKVPLFVRSQIHRHRTFSYNEISRRYVKDNLEFYWPDKWRKAADNVKQGSSDEEIELAFDYKAADDTDPLYQRKVSMQEWMEDAARMCVHHYNLALNRGVCAEQARMILPQNLYTQFYMTGNLRNWAHFLKLRLDPHAQKEVQIVANLCAEIIEPLFPVSFKALMENDS